MQCQGHLKNWNQCRRTATRRVLELPIPPNAKPEDWIFHYCNQHADESMAGGLAREVRLPSEQFIDR